MMPRPALLVLALLACLCSGQANAADYPKYCTQDAERWLFLIDRTDNYDELDQKRLAEGIAALYNEMQAQAVRQGARGLLFQVFAMTDRPGNLSPEWSSCVPACPLVDGKEDCPDVLVQRDRRSFFSTFRQKLAPLINEPAVTPGSEIVRTLSMLASEFENRRIARLVVFSDMIEYSDLSKRVSTFSKSDAVSLRRAIARARLEPASNAFRSTAITVFGTGKRLGQDIKEESQGPSMALNSAAYAALKTFWLGYLREVAPQGSVSVRQNYLD